MLEVLATGFSPARLHQVVLEVSPHAVLMPYLSENLNEMKYVPCLNKKRPGATHMLMALGTLFTSGVEVDWAKALSPAIEQASGDLKIPSLVWQHKDPIRSVTWVLPYSHNQKGAPALLQVPKPQEGRQRALSDAAAREAAEGSNQLLITPEKQEYLRDHIVDGECVLPGAFYVCAAVQRGHMLQNAGFHRYLSLHDKFMKEDAKGGVPLNIVADGPRMALCSNGDPETNEHFSCFLPRFPPAQPELMFKVRWCWGLSSLSLWVGCDRPCVPLFLFLWDQLAQTSVDADAAQQVHVAHHSGCCPSPPPPVVVVMRGL